jgi:hypothetical protein
MDVAATDDLQEWYFHQRSPPHSIKVRRFEPLNAFVESGGNERRYSCHLRRAIDLWNDLGVILGRRCCTSSVGLGMMMPLVEEVIATISLFIPGI